MLPARLELLLVGWPLLGRSSEEEELDSIKNII
jgi:hypothetical protein